MPSGINLIKTNAYRGHNLHLSNYISYSHRQKILSDLIRPAFLLNE